MENCIDSLGYEEMFAPLDAKRGYWQVEIEEEDKDRTAFTSHNGFYQLMSMPYGLNNAPGTFQRIIDSILSQVKYQYALI